MARLLHISDLHYHHRVPFLGRGLKAALGRLELWLLQRAKRFALVEQHIEQLKTDIASLAPDHVFLTGDLTALGFEEELQFAHDRFSGLLKAGRMTIVPGNHDRYSDPHGARTFERLFAAYLKSDLPEYAISHGYPFVQLRDKLAIIGLDSTRVRGMSHYFFGRIGPEQLAALDRLLGDARLDGKTVLIAVHHPPRGPKGLRRWPQMDLLDSEELLEVLKRRKCLLLHGHSHERYRLHRAEERPESFGAGSSTEHGSEGFWLLDVDGHQVNRATQFRPGCAILAG